MVRLQMGHAFLAKIVWDYCFGDFKVFLGVFFLQYHIISML
jgi:hypothetical protein